MMMAGAEIPARGEGSNAGMLLQGIVICGVGDQQNKLERRRVRFMGHFNEFVYVLCQSRCELGKKEKNPSPGLRLNFMSQPPVFGPSNL
jgi:hypothetical protein